MGAHLETKLKKQIFLTLRIQGKTTRQAIDQMKEEDGFEINRQQVYNWIVRDSRFRAKLELIDEEVCDRYEEALHELRDKGNTEAVKTGLFYFGRKRGWSNRYEVTGSGGGPILWQVVDRFVGPEDKQKDKPTTPKGELVNPETIESGPKDELDF